MSRTPTFFPDNEGIWIQWFGHPLRYLATAAETEGKYCLSVGSIDEGRGASPHSHNFDEGFYILAGVVEFTAGNRKVRLTQGDFIHIKAGTVHYPRGATAGPSRMLVMAAPCGFDAFQIRVGGRIDGPTGLGSRSEAQMHQTASEIAAEHGIDMNPTEEAANATPRVLITKAGEGQAFDVFGNRYRLLAEAADTDGAYAIWHATIPPGGGPPPHTHRREDVGFFVLSGELQYEIDGNCFVAAQGAFVNCPSGSLYRFCNARTATAEVITLVAPGGVEQLLQRVGRSVDALSEAIAPPTADEYVRLRNLEGDYEVDVG